MSKQTLTRPLTALIVGCIDDLSQSVGKMFDNPRFTSDKDKSPDTTGLDVIVIITKAVSHRLIEFWHEYGRDHDILVVNGDSKSMIIERMNELVTILEPQRSEPRLNAVPINYDPEANFSSAQPDSAATVTKPAGGTAITAFMQEVQDLQKAKEDAEAVALKEMEKADKLAQELAEVRESIPSEEAILKRVSDAVEKRASGLVLERTRELEADLKQDRKTLEDKIKEVGRAEKKREKAEAEKVKAQEEIDRLEQSIDDLKLQKNKWELTPRKIRVLAGMHLTTATMLIGSENVVRYFERFLSDTEHHAEIGPLLDEVVQNTSGTPPKDVVEATITALLQKTEPVESPAK